MAYTNAIYFLDFTLGSDATRSTLTPSAYADNGGGLVRITLTSNTYVTGAVVDIAGTTGSVYVGAWIITRIDATHMDLQGSTYTSNPATKGTVVPRGGSSWTDAWKTITSGATAVRHQAGDTVRIAKSPAPASVGTATWNGSGVEATKAIESSTNATPIVVTITGHGYSTDDYVQITSHSTNTNANGFWKISKVNDDSFQLLTTQGANSVGNGTGVATGTCQRANGKVIVLDTSQTYTITDCGTVWTGANDGTTSLVQADTGVKEGSTCSKITLDSAVQTNKMQGYFATGTLNLSSYQGISFWFKNSSVIGNATTWTVTLCSDASGATPVDTFVIPAIDSASYFIPLTIMKSGGGNLGSSIQSIAFNSAATAPANSSSITFDDIIAVTTNGLNIQSLISKNTLEQSTVSSVNYGNEAWYAIQSINGSVVVLDNAPQTNVNVGRGYSGTSENVTTYKRETVKSTTLTTSSVGTFNQSGTPGNVINYFGGYNTSDTNTCDGETFLDGLIGHTSAHGLVINSCIYIKITKLNPCRFSQNIQPSNTSYFEIDISNSNNGTYGYLNGAGVYNPTVTILNTVNNITNNIGLGSNGVGKYTILNASNSNTIGISFSGAYENNLMNEKSLNNGIYAVSFGNTRNNTINNSSLSGLTGCVSSTLGKNYFNNCIMTGTEVGNTTANGNTKVFSTNHDQTLNNHWIFTDGGTINYQTTTYHASSAGSWKFSPDSTRIVNYPLNLSIAKIACTANNEVTYKAWCKKDHATNVAMKLIVRAGNIGIASDIEVTQADNTDWQELTLTFTPTLAGVVEVEAVAWYVAGVSYCYVGGTATITQV